MEAGIPDGAGVTQYDDSRIHDNAQPVIITKIEMPKESPWKQPAVYIAILALIVSLGGEWRRWVALDDDKRSNAMWMALVYSEYDSAKAKLDAQGIHLKALPAPPK